MRIFLGSLVAALAVGAAMWLFGLNAGSNDSFEWWKETGGASTEAGWEDPLAAVVAVAGLGAAAGIILRRGKSDR
jgi:hypothetical protein